MQAVGTTHHFNKYLILKIAWPGWEEKEIQSVDNISITITISLFIHENFMIMNYMIMIMKLHFEHIDACDSDSDKQEVYFSKIVKHFNE
jgi:hypothetical protein